MILRRQGDAELDAAAQAARQPGRDAVGHPAHRGLPVAAGRAEPHGEIHLPAGGQGEPGDHGLAGDGRLDLGAHVRVFVGGRDRPPGGEVDLAVRLRAAGGDWQPAVSRVADGIAARLAGRLRRGVELSVTRDPIGS